MLLRASVGLWCGSDAARVPRSVVAPEGRFEVVSARRWQGLLGWRAAAASDGPRPRPGYRREWRTESRGGSSSVGFFEAPLSRAGSADRLRVAGWAMQRLEREDGEDFTWTPTERASELEAERPDRPTCEGATGRWAGALPRRRGRRAAARRRRIGKDSAGDERAGYCAYSPPRWYLERREGTQWPGNSCDRRRAHGLRLLLGRRPCDGEAGARLHTPQ